MPDLPRPGDIWAPNENATHPFNVLVTDVTVRTAHQRHTLGWTDTVYYDRQLPTEFQTVRSTMSLFLCRYDLAFRPACRVYRKGERLL